jgi:predicted nucleotidyltransferase
MIAVGSNAGRSAMVSMGVIEEYVRRLVREFRPIKVVLFGSHAYGVPTLDSDVDLLVVMPDGGDPLTKAGEIRSRIPRNFSLDLIVRDPDTLRRRIEQHDWFLKEVDERGKVLHEASDR